MQTAPSKKHRLTPPLDTSRFSSEKHVKTMVKQLLDHHGWFHWMPPANGYGTLGIHDHNAFKDGVFLTVESKYGKNKPSALQCSFAAQIIANDGFSFCVNETNIDHLALWLESFEIAKRHQMEGKEIPQEHGSRMLNAIAALTDMFQQAAPTA